MYQAASSPQGVRARRLARGLAGDPRVRRGKAAVEWLRKVDPKTDEGVRALLNEPQRVAVDISGNLVERVEEERVVQEVQCQTQAFMPRPRSPPYVPAKTGVDRATQIEEECLFNFDVEVEPLLHVIVSKTIEQSMLEVRREEERAHLARNKAFYLSEKDRLRAAEFEREQAEIRRWQAKEAHKRREALRLQQDLLLCEKSAACALFQLDFAGPIRAQVFERLEGSELFPNVLHNAIVGEFLPWLEGRVAARCSELQLARRLANELVQNALKLRRDTAQGYRKAICERKAREEAERVRAAEEAERLKREAEEAQTIRIFLRAPPRDSEYDEASEQKEREGQTGASIGPISLSLKDTVAQAERKIEAWLAMMGFDISKPEDGFLQLALAQAEAEAQHDDGSQEGADETAGSHAVEFKPYDEELTLEFLNLIGDKQISRERGQDEEDADEDAGAG